MKRLIIKLFLSLCLWAVLPVCAQDAVHYYFRTMDIRNGLSQNTVYQILQDRKGFMWFGTKDGLNRYDGLSFRIYKKENSGLGKNFITALYEDRRGNIWIGTEGYGLTKFSGRSFEHYGTLDGLSTASIWSISPSKIQPGGRCSSWRLTGRFLSRIWKKRSGQIC